MLMAEQEPYALMVQPDDMLISPREVNDNFGTMVCFHPRYALGDHHNYIDKDDFLREMYLNTVGNNERGTERYERMVNMVWSRKMTGDHPDPRAVDDAMLRVISEKYVVMPLYLLDHSGLAMQTESFHDPWDSGQVGWVYVSKEDVLKEFGGEKMTGALRKKAEDLLRGEVAEYDAYLRGECYGFELYKNGELSDSCWGFIGSLEDACKAMADYLPDECKGMTEHLSEVKEPASMIMIGLMMPFFFFAMYEKDGQPAEKLLRNRLRYKLWPKDRPYRTENFYKSISKKEVSQIAKNQTAGGAGKTSAKKRKAGKKDPHRSKKGRK